MNIKAYFIINHISWYFSESAILAEYLGILTYKIPFIMWKIWFYLHGNLKMKVFTFPIEKVKMRNSAHLITSGFDPLFLSRKVDCSNESDFPIVKGWN